MNANEQKITEAVGNACAEICNTMQGIKIDPNLVLIAVMTLGNPPIVSR